MPAIPLRAFETLIHSPSHNICFEALLLYVIYIFTRFHMEPTLLKCVNRLYPVDVETCLV